MEMKATGIVRHIDDLGRVVIPKEIRRTMGIREGDSLEMFTADGGVVFKKYDTTKDRQKYAQDWLQVNKNRLDVQGVRFSIQGDLTICEGIKNGQWVRGFSKRDPKDPICPAIGMVYAYCRAFDVAVPDELQ